MAFIQNNIRYRSVTSQEFAYFYNAKAIILSDLINEKHQFSEVARELVLLHFNSYTSWASDVEYILLNNHVVTSSHIENLVNRINKITKYHQQLFDIHSDLFNPVFIQAWKNTSLPAFVSKITEVEGLNHLEAFPRIIVSLTHYLQTCMYELYELDCLLGGGNLACATNSSNIGKMLIYVDDFVLDYAEKTGTFLCGERLDHYANLACGKFPVVVKNYSSKKLEFFGRFEGDAQIVELFEPLCKRFDILNVISSPPEDEHLYRNR